VSQEVTNDQDELADPGSWSVHSVGRVEAAVRFLQAFYGFWLFLLSLLTLMVLLIEGPSHYPIGRWMSMGVCLGDLTATYWGLRLRKPWGVQLIAAGSAYAIFPSLMARPETVVPTVPSLMAIVICRSAVALSLWQLWVFTRPETKGLFGAHGKYVF
jgi:hypothetical protein